MEVALQMIRRLPAKYRVVDQVLNTFPVLYCFVKTLNTYCWKSLLTCIVILCIFQKSMNSLKSLWLRPGGAATGPGSRLTRNATLAFQSTGNL